jgi:hypothetical protein
MKIQIDCQFLHLEYQHLWAIRGCYGIDVKVANGVPGFLLHSKVASRILSPISRLQIFEQAEIEFANRGATAEWDQIIYVYEDDLAQFLNHYSALG